MPASEDSAKEIERINRLGDRLRNGLRAALREKRIVAQVTGLGSLVGLHFTDQPVSDYRSAIRADREMMLSLHLSLLNHGISARPGGGFFLSTAVTEPEIDRTVELFGKALDDLG